LASPLGRKKSTLLDYLDHNTKNMKYIKKKKMLKPHSKL
jgi:hypothetical protein